MFVSKAAVGDWVTAKRTRKRIRENVKGKFVWNSRIDWKHTLPSGNVPISIDD
jgi:hypothetical protein